jgi:sarcosine oxidase subunit gamma
VADLHIGESDCQFSVLRIWRPGPELHEALSREFGLPWPSQPNTVASHGATVLWLAPGEWAIAGLSVAEAAARAARACGPALHDVADVSDGRVQFDVSGALARDLLSKGCSLDLHPRAFGPGACAQSLLAQVPVLITVVSAASAPTTYRLWADASLAHYLRAWFVDAALEFSAR